VSFPGYLLSERQTPEGILVLEFRSALRLGVTKVTSRIVNGYKHLRSDLTNSAAAHTPDGKVRQRPLARGLAIRSLHPCVTITCP